MTRHTIRTLVLATTASLAIAACASKAPKQLPHHASQTSASVCSGSRCYSRHTPRLRHSFSRLEGSQCQVAPSK